MNIGPFIQINDLDSSVSSKLESAKPQQSRKHAGTVGATTSAVRGILLQPLYLWYRTPLKLFRPLRVDYLATARALLPHNVLSQRVSLRGSTLGMISNAVKQRGWSFLPRYVLQPMLANWLVGFTLFTTYTTVLPAAYAQASSQYSISSRDVLLPWYPPFVAGAAAGLAQSAVATPLDSLRVRFEVEHMVSGRYCSWWGFVKEQLSQTGWRGLYRGLKLTMTKDVAGYAGFFGLFEWIKNETIDMYRDLIRVACRDDLFQPGSEISRLSKERVLELRTLLGQSSDEIGRQGWVVRNPVILLPVLLLPPALGKPACVLFAGAIAAIAYQAVDFPLEQFRTRLYAEAASGELLRKTLSQHFPLSARNSYSLPTPYRAAWKSLVDVAVREHRYPVQNRAVMTAIAVRYLYRGWLGVAVRSIPAASVGLVVYELLKSSL
ncbi:hypothetical protein GGI21_001046 [Coemansia aciculifera]|uniref:Uncharacterized protein n=1 Tax=Coemansia aciculifera TaxID=417176 RepID=A0ACC1M6H3_9FUNG|nr:hypothetical protein IWW38_001978 [Coemansia aciculifera]KAJ2910270.1 hypothetical protein GGI21_001046 [Coemansia aciculifera]